MSVFEFIKKLLSELGSTILWIIKELRSVKLWILVATFYIWQQSIIKGYGVEIISASMAIILPYYFYNRTKDHIRDDTKLGIKKDEVIK